VQKEAQIAVLTSQVEELKANQAYFETVAARLDELRENQPIHRTAEQLTGLH